jgi:hypothetical protein
MHFIGFSEYINPPFGLFLGILKNQTDPAKAIRRTAYFN